MVAASRQSTTDRPSTKFSCRLRLPKPTDFQRIPNPHSHHNSTKQCRLRTPNRDIGILPVSPRKWWVGSQQASQTITQVYSPVNDLPRVQNRRQPRRTIKTPNQRRIKHTLPSQASRSNSRRRCGRRSLVSKIQTHSREENAQSHCLAVVEARVGRPAGVVDVRLVEIGCEGSHGVEEVGEGYEGAAGGEE